MGISRYFIFLLLMMLFLFLVSCSSGGSTGNPTGDSDSVESTDQSENEISQEDEENSQGLLAASPEEIRFGAVVLGDTSTETLTLTNDGEEDLTISVVRINEATTPEFSVQAMLQGDQAIEVPVVLVPGQNLAVILQYAPVDAGSDTGTLQIIGQDFQGNILEIPLFADEKGESALDVTPSLEFGYAGNIGEEETQALTIWNLPEDPQSNRTLQVTKLEVAEGTRDFHLDLDSCAASSQHPILIAPGLSHSCSVVFSPREAGELSGAIHIETNASEGETSGNINLSGRCAPPETVLTLVVNPRGEPVPGAELRLWGEDAVLATTDSRGRAVILPEAGGQIFAVDGAMSVKGMYSRQYKQVLPEDEVSVFVVDLLPVETSQPVSLGQVSASNLDGAVLQFASEDVQIPNGVEARLFMGEGHPSAAPYDPPEGMAVAQMVWFGPDGMAFTNPARLTLPNTLNLAPSAQVQFYLFSEATLTWDEAALLKVNAEGTLLETIEGGISHFSTGGIFIPLEELEDYVVTGLVKDDLDELLEGIHVFAMGTRGWMMHETSNGEGRYTISGVRVAKTFSPFITVMASRSENLMNDEVNSVIADVTGESDEVVHAPVIVLHNNVDKGSVRGKALSPLGTPVEGACVTIYPSIGTEKSTWTFSEDDDQEGDDQEEDPGTFLFSSVPAGPARLTITHDGLRLFKEIHGDVPENGEWNLGELILDEVADTEPPHMLWSMPAHGQENLVGLTEVRVVFNETIDPTSVQAKLKRSLTGETISGSATLENGTTVVFTPDVSLENGRAYSFMLGAGLADEAGNAIGENYTLIFRTVESTCPPEECRAGEFVRETESCAYESFTDGTLCDAGDGPGSGECLSGECQPFSVDGDEEMDEEEISEVDDTETSCLPKTCEDLGYECGTWPDGCGGNTESCGTCDSGFVCHETFGQCNIDCPGGVTARRVDEAYFPGTTQAVYAADGYVYTSRGAILDIYTDDGDQLQKVNDIHLAWTIEDIFVVDGWAYVAFDIKGLAILDVSDPMNLGEPVYRDTNGHAWDVFVSGNYAYVAAEGSGLAVIDISDPMNPGEPVYRDTDGNARDVFVSGNYAYVANANFGLAVIDISDPMNPGEPVYRDTDGNAGDVFVSGNYAYVADRVSGLAMIDISDPTNPGEPIYREMVGYFYDVFVSESYVYVAMSSGLAIIDISDPTNPGEPVYSNTTWSVTKGVFVSGSYAYVADGGGLAIINVSDPTTPGEPQYEVAKGGVVWDVFVSDNYAYMADLYEGLAVIDISDPTNPGEPVYKGMNGDIRGIFISGKYAYMANGTFGLAVIDISDPTTPGEPVYRDTEDRYAVEVFVSGNYAYVADVEAGLAVIDISDPTTPGESVHRDTDGYARDVFISGNYAYVADDEAGLAVIDISDPTAPGEPIYRDTNRDTENVFVSGNYVYMDNYSSGLAVIDISDPTNPGEPVYGDTNGSADAIFVSGNYAYVANDFEGLAVIDISDPTNPGEPVCFEKTGRGHKVFVFGNHAWVAEGSNGMETFELRCVGTCTPDPCHGHGTCAIVDGDAACTCDQGFGGDWCERCAEGYEGYPDCVTDQTTPGFVPIEAGTFWMGSPDGDCPAGYPGNCIDELGRGSTEELHEVTLTYDFELQAHEVTQGEWFAAFGNNPSYFGPNGDGTNCGDDCPVERVNWVEVLAYANWLSLEHGLAPCYTLMDCTGTLGGGCASYEDYCEADTYSCTVSLNGVEKPQDCEGYRLPTEAEWEYAIRVGDQYTAFYQSDGNNGTITYTGSDPVDPNLDQIGWFTVNTDPLGTKPVGNKEANSWGLYDMSGNVLERVWDWHQYDYETDVGTDPVGPSTGTGRVVRGGGWYGGAQYCRSANRDGLSPGFRAYDVGFRLARTLHPDSCAPDPCNNHGTCNDTNGYALCDCNTGYDGSDCSVCAEGYEGYPDCRSINAILRLELIISGLTGDSDVDLAWLLPNGLRCDESNVSASGECMVPEGSGLIHVEACGSLNECSNEAISHLDPPDGTYQIKVTFDENCSVISTFPIDCLAGVGNQVANCTINILKGRTLLWQISDIYLHEKGETRMWNFVLDQGVWQEPVEIE